MPDHVACTCDAANMTPPVYHVDHAEDCEKRVAREARSQASTARWQTQESLEPHAYDGVGYIDMSPWSPGPAFQCCVRCGERPDHPIHPEPVEIGNA
jgi:hypothetical protein